jgi:hypothetical protein
MHRLAWVADGFLGEDLRAGKLGRENCALAEKRAFHAHPFRHPRAVLGQNTNSEISSPYFSNIKSVFSNIKSILSILSPFYQLSSPFYKSYFIIYSVVVSSTSDKNMAERNMKWFGNTIQQTGTKEGSHNKLSSTAHAIAATGISRSR